MAIVDGALTSTSAATPGATARTVAILTQQLLRERPNTNRRQPAKPLAVHRTTPRTAATHRTLMSGTPTAASTSSAPATPRSASWCSTCPRRWQPQPWDTAPKPLNTTPPPPVNPGPTTPRFAEPVERQGTPPAGGLSQGQSPRVWLKARFCRSRSFSRREVAMPAHVGVTKLRAFVTARTSRRETGST